MSDPQMKQYVSITPIPVSQDVDGKYRYRLFRFNVTNLGNATPPPEPGCYYIEFRVDFKHVDQDLEGLGYSRYWHDGGKLVKERMLGPIITMTQSVHDEPAEAGIPNVHAQGFRFIGPCDLPQEDCIPL